jgi:hypothetical protein
VVKAFDSNVYTLLISNPFVGKSSNLLGVDILLFLHVDVVTFAERRAEFISLASSFVGLADWAERRGMRKEGRQVESGTESGFSRSNTGCL